MRKILWTLALLAASWQVSAGSIYFAPSLFMQRTVSDTDNFHALYMHLAAGYWDVIDCFYLAGELFIVPATVSISESNPQRDESIRTTYAWGVSFLPGLLLTEKVVAFLRMGYVATRFWGPDTTKSGGQIGVGLQSELSKNWDLRGEYIYTAYTNTSNIGSPKTDQYGIGLIYKLQ